MVVEVKIIFKKLASHMTLHLRHPASETDQIPRAISKREDTAGQVIGTVVKEVLNFYLEDLRRTNNSKKIPQSQGLCRLCVYFLFLLTCNQPYGICKRIS